jgi:hypothetical protein
MSDAYGEMLEMAKEDHRAREKARHMMDFVREVASHKDGVTPKGLKRVATREEDKARQAARKLGLVEYMNARWTVTPKGKVWIEQPVT